MHAIEAGAATAVTRLLATGLAVAAAAGPATAAPSTADLFLSADGAYVIDKQTRVAWPRCVEGMRWTGRTCTGAPYLLTHSEAMARVAARQREGVAWRLPRVRELQRLVRSGANAQGLDTALFPGAVSDWHWSASVSIDTTSVNQYAYNNVRRGVTGDNVNRIAFRHGWAVHLGSGESAGDVDKRTRMPLRVVLSLD